MEKYSVLQLSLVYDVVTTLLVFVVSLVTQNSTWYDPYWSVAPLPLSLYFMYHASLGNGYRQAIVLTLVTVWAARLTFNWARGFVQQYGPTSEHNQDWRYVYIQELFHSAGLGVLYWPVGSLLGIHLFPTLLVFLGLCSVFVAMNSSATLSPVDALGATVTIIAILIETVADEQLKSFVLAQAKSESSLGVMRKGLWRYSRHPNYFGETLYWVGLYIIAVGSSAKDWVWLLVGPVAMLLLFLFISIPLMERRLVKRRPGYRQYQKETSFFVPWPP